MVGAASFFVCIRYDFEFDVGWAVHLVTKREPLLREGERSTEREDTCNSAPQITPTTTRIRRSHPTVFPC